MDAHDAERLTRALDREGLAAHWRDGILVCEDPGLVVALRAWHGKLSTFNRLIREIAKREDRPIKPYKPMDHVVLVLAILLGLRAGDLADVVHEVIWRQPFPNANHRTVVAAIEDELGKQCPEDVLRKAVTPLFMESKKLLDGSNTSLSNADAKQRHLQLAARLVAAVQSIK